MGIDTTELVMNWGLNFIEFFSFYLIICALLGFKSMEAVKKFSLKTMGFAIGYSLFMGTTLYFLRGFRFQAIGVVVMIATVRFVSKQLNVSLSRTNTILVYFLLYLLPQLLIPILWPLSSFIVSTVVLNISAFIVVLLVTFSVFMFIELTWLFKLVTAKFIVQLIIFMFFALFVVSFIIFNFENEYMFENIWLFIVLSVIAMNSLYYMFKFAHEYMSVLPDKFHDVKKILNLLNSKIDEMDDFEALKEATQEVMDLLDIEPVKAEEISTETKNEFERYLLKTIAFIQKENNSTTEIITKIDYEGPHPTIKDVRIAYFLGILLENAIQTLTRKPIYINVISSSSFVVIEVANEAKYKEKAYLEAILKTGQTSSKKALIGRGFGLAKLKRAVKKHYGKISVSAEPDSLGRINYLSVLIRF